MATKVRLDESGPVREQHSLIATRHEPLSDFVRVGVAERAHCWSRRLRFGVEGVHELLNGSVLLCSFCHTLVDQPQAGLVVFNVCLACGVFVVAIVLNLLAFVAHFVEAEGGGRAFEEVPK